MEGILNAIKDTPIPTLLIVVGVIFIFLGIVTRIHTIEVPTQQRLWAVIVGIFFIFIGLILNYYTSQELKYWRGNDSPGPDNDIMSIQNIPEKECIKKCKITKDCKAVVVSPQNECWLKKYLKDPLTVNPSRTIIDVK